MAEPDAAKPRGRIRFLIGSALLLLAAAGLVCFGAAPIGLLMALWRLPAGSPPYADPFSRLAWEAALAVPFAVGVLLATSGLLAIAAERAITRQGRGLLIAAGVVGALAAAMALRGFLTVQEWVDDLEVGRLDPGSYLPGGDLAVTLGSEFLVVGQGLFLAGGLLGFSSLPSRLKRSSLLGWTVAITQWSVLVMASYFVASWYLDGREIRSALAPSPSAIGTIQLPHSLAALISKSVVAGWCLLAYSLSLALIGILLPGMEPPPGPAQGE